MAKIQKKWIVLSIKLNSLFKGKDGQGKKLYFYSMFFCKCDLRPYKNLSVYV